MFDKRKLKTFSWVNVGNPDHEDFQRLLNEYKIDEDTISDILPGARRLPLCADLTAFGWTWSMCPII